MPNSSITFLLLVVAAFFSAAAPASAEAIRAYVAEFKSSPPDYSGRNVTLQTLLSSRLSGEDIISAPSEAEADVIVSATYTRIGKVFSVDAAARRPRGKVVANVFEQGEDPDALIPAIGKVAAKLRAEILKEAASRPAPVPAKGEPTAAPPKVMEQRDWTSQRIDGAMRAIGVATPAGEEAWIIGKENLVQLCRLKGTEVISLAREEIPFRLLVIAVDTLESTGGTLVFVSAASDDRPASRVYLREGDRLHLVAQDLPYHLRVISLDGGARKLFAQQVDPANEYMNEVYEASFEQGKVQLKSPIKMPRYANIYNFNRFTDSEGRSHPITFSEDGYLVVYSDKGEELWRSSEKFGGSETFHRKRDSEYEHLTGSPYRKRFIDQRIVVTERKEIVVPKNDGTFLIGDSRSFNRYNMVTLTWNGSSLEEKWRSHQIPSYLADYLYQPVSRKLTLLEVVQKEGFFGKGGSALRVMALP